MTTAVGGHQERQKSTSATADQSALDRGRHLPVEDTDLERRVLAHERILQALIAHMAETEPRFVDRLRATFGSSDQLRRSEHDYVDTESYAEQFIKEVTRLGSTLGRVAPDARSPVRPAEHPRPAGSVDAPNSARKRDSFEVSIRAGVWNVNKNGRFFGDFLSRADAQRTINAALPGSAAEGRIVTVSWPEDQDKGP